MKGCLFWILFWKRENVLLIFPKLEFRLFGWVIKPFTICFACKVRLLHKLFCYSHEYSNPNKLKFPWKLVAICYSSIFLSAQTKGNWSYDAQALDSQSWGLEPKVKITQGCFKACKFYSYLAFWCCLTSQLAFNCNYKSAGSLATLLLRHNKDTSKSCAWKVGRDYAKANSELWNAVGNYY